MMEPKDFYNLGKRDAYCELFMMIRVDGIDKTLKSIASQIRENPHAKLYLELTT